MTISLIILATLVLFRFWFKTYSTNKRYGYETDLIHLENELYKVKNKLTSKDSIEGFELMKNRIRSIKSDIYKITLLYVFANARKVDVEDPEFLKHKEWSERIIKSNDNLKFINDSLTSVLLKVTVETSILIKFLYFIAKASSYLKTHFSHKSEKSFAYPLKQKVMVSLSNYEVCV